MLAIALCKTHQLLVGDAKRSQSNFAFQVSSCGNLGPGNERLRTGIAEPETWYSKRFLRTCHNGRFASEHLRMLRMFAIVCAMMLGVIMQPEQKESATATKLSERQNGG